jgi:hypothetical protein
MIGVMKNVSGYYQIFMHLLLNMQDYLLLSTVPSPNQPCFSKLFDIYIYDVIASGRERIVEEYLSLVRQAEWNYSQTLRSARESRVIEVIEGRK